MPSQQLQLPVCLVPFRLQQSETVDGGAEDAFQVVVIGLVVGVRREAIMPRGKGMDQTGLAAGLAKGALHGTVVGAGHLHGHDVILQCRAAGSLRGVAGGQFQRGALVFHDGRRDEYLAVEVAEHPLRAGFGTIYGDDAEAFRPDLLHAGLDHALGFAQYGWTDCAGFARIAFCSHSNVLLSWERG